MIKWPSFNLGEKYKLIQDPFLKAQDSKNYCDHIVQTITFKWNGDVVPCCFDIEGDYVIGNIMEKPLSDLWNNEKYKEIRKSIHQRNYIPLCSNCNAIHPQLFVVKKNRAKQRRR
jgi:radical SAM protein with 4Fe4S-binding SPASM domain